MGPPLHSCFPFAHILHSQLFCSSSLQYSCLSDSYWESQVPSPVAWSLFWAQWKRKEPKSVDHIGFGLSSHHGGSYEVCSNRRSYGGVGNWFPMSQWLKAHTLATLRESKVEFKMCPIQLIFAWIFSGKGRAWDKAEPEIRQSLLSICR